jgi:hypothetical protein
LYNLYDFYLYSILSIYKYSIIFYLYCIISICILYFPFFYLYDCLHCFVTMDFIGLIYPTHIVTGKKGWHNICPRQGPSPGRPRRNSLMLPQDQRSEPAGLPIYLTPSLYQLSWADLKEGGGGWPLWDLWSTKKKKNNEPSKVI